MVETAGKDWSSGEDGDSIPSMLYIVILGLQVTDAS